MLEKQPGNCVHTSITRESVMISSTQVLFTVKCPGMNAGILCIHTWAFFSERYLSKLFAASRLIPEDLRVPPEVSHQYSLQPFLRDAPVDSQGGYGIFMGWEYFF